jgi:hypothetical protein
LARVFAAEDKAASEEESNAQEEAEEEAAAQAVAKMAAPVQDKAKVQTLYEGSKSSRAPSRGERELARQEDAHVRRGNMGRGSSNLEQRLASEERQADSAMARIKQLTAGI